MKKLTLLFTLLFQLSATLFAQDTNKVIRHEVGFNTVSLIKQLISNNPSNTLEQLPYDIYYNFYFNSKSALRIGLGVQNTNTSTEIEGQTEPRTTGEVAFNLRMGLGKDIVSYKHLSLNAFADVLFKNSSLNTVNTSTSQNFPNPVLTTKTTSSDITTGFGAQVGLGVKYNLLKHLAVYIEVPMTYMAESMKSELTFEEEGSSAVSSSNKTFSTNLQISLPTTIYLVLRF